MQIKLLIGSQNCDLCDMTCCLMTLDVTLYMTFYMMSLDVTFDMSLDVTLDMMSLDIISGRIRC